MSSFRLSRGKTRKFLAGSSLALLVCAAPGAHAFFPTPCTAETVTTMTNAMLTLSTDIGTMADRILVTQDNIGEMADRIGEMADRIVVTEEMMLTTLQQLNSSGALNGAAAGVLLTAPVTGEVASRWAPPVIELSSEATSYVLYVAPTANFSSDQVLPLLVTPESPLSVVWPQALESMTVNDVYVAVREVSSQNGLSALSNAVRLTLQ
ncbi:MAG TPA: hypothetical protein VK979_07120 [Guyparkeria sp.]|nr:hypothetical protein [Guyparkeria sp.]